MSFAEIHAKAMAGGYAPEQAPVEIPEIPVDVHVHRDRSVGRVVFVAREREPACRGKRGRL